MCHKHGMPITCWCKDCNDITCYKCLLAQHKKHDVESIDETVHMKNYVLNRLITLKGVKLAENDEIHNIDVNLKSTLEKVVEFEKLLDILSLIHI